MFCHLYPTGTCVAGNGEVRSFRDNAALSLDNNLSASSSCDCQHRGGRELGSSGMVNLRESLINTVIDNKLKMLTSLSQKASGKVRRLLSPSSQTRNATGGKARPNPLTWYSCATW